MKRREFIINYVNTVGIYVTTISNSGSNKNCITINKTDIPI